MKVLAKTTECVKRNRNVHIGPAIHVITTTKPASDSDIYALFFVCVSASLFVQCDHDDASYAQIHFLRIRVHHHPRNTRQRISHHRKSDAPIYSGDANARFIRACGPPTPVRRPPLGICDMQCANGSCGIGGLRQRVTDGAIKDRQSLFHANCIARMHTAASQSVSASQRAYARDNRDLRHWLDYRPAIISLIIILNPYACRATRD